MALACIENHYDLAESLIVNFPNEVGLILSAIIDFQVRLYLYNIRI